MKRDASGRAHDLAVALGLCLLAVVAFRNAGPDELVLDAVTLIRK